MAHVMWRYCHLCIHVVAHLLEWWGAIVGTDIAKPVRPITNGGRLQFTTGIDDRLLLLLWDLCLLVGMRTVRLLGYHTAHLTRGTVRPRVRWVHRLLVVTHTVVGWKSGIGRHVSLACVCVVVIHLLARVQAVHAGPGVVPVHI